MNTSEPYAVRAEGLGRSFRIFHSDFYRILDLFVPVSAKRYEEVWVLRDLRLEIGKGEKVGIIGRNGAGKTTLLNMIAGHLAPTAGRLEVDGRVSALFTLGTGFHPEFSGRENIRSALAFQGVGGAKARELEAEIIAFTELQKVIDRPVKTYSAGMYARLAFTVATAIEPEILILDEILGAGDAYFNARAVERMRKLTGGGTTVLFVSHDLASVQKLCDRCIWIDRGRIREDGRALDVIKAYSADVRRRDTLRLLAENTGEVPDEAAEETQLLFRFLTAGGGAPAARGLFIHRIALYVQGRLYGEIGAGEAMDNAPGQPGRLITGPKINWSQGLEKDGRRCREFRDFGGEYVHAAGVFSLPPSVDAKAAGFSVCYYDDFDGPVLFERYGDGAYRTLLTLESGGTRRWKEVSFMPEDSAPGPSAAPDDVYGTGELLITDFRILGEGGEEKHVFTVGEKVVFRIRFRAFETVRSPAFVVAVYLPDGTTVTQMFEQEEGRIVAAGEEGHVDFRIASMKIGRGEYLVSAAVFRDIDPADPAEGPAYCVHDRKYRFRMEQPFGINLDLGIAVQEYATEYGR